MSSNEVRVKCGTGTDDLAVTVYADFAKFNELFRNATVVGSGEVVDKQFTRAGSSVRRYPGDPSPFTRASAEVEVSVIPVSSQQTTPGRPFTVEFSGSSAFDPKSYDVRQFTLLTDWSGFHAYASANCRRPMRIRSPGGRPALVSPPPG